MELGNLHQPSRIEGFLHKARFLTIICQMISEYVKIFKEPEKILSKQLVNNYIKQTVAKYVAPKRFLIV